MPQASTETKYYRSNIDLIQDKTFILRLVLLALVEDGCAHLNCVGPGAPSDFTVSTAPVDYQYTYTGGSAAFGL